MHDNTSGLQVGIPNDGSHNMVARHLHVIHLLVRRLLGDAVAFLLYPHDKWLDAAGLPYLTLPTKRSVTEPLAPFLQGTPIEAFVDRVAQEDLGLARDDYVLERELEAVEKDLESPAQHTETQYTIYPLDVWVAPAQLAALGERLGGEWLTPEEALAHSQLSPTARAVFIEMLGRHEKYTTKPPPLDNPPKPGQARVRQQAEALRQVFAPPAERPSMEGLALKWLSRNRGGVRHLAKGELDEILAAGNRAFNLRVADPYLRYQMQGLGFTWSFFTHKDPQDCHVHGAPVVEVYGILEGRLKIWWKPYYDRGTAAWSHRILEAGDWLEVDSLQCHIVHWLTEGKGVVFKAGPGPLAEVGKIGVKGKTPCMDCPCMKPRQVVALTH